MDPAKNISLMCYQSTGISRFCFNLSSTTAKVILKLVIFSEYCVLHFFGTSVSVHFYVYNKHTVYLVCFPPSCISTSYLDKKVPPEYLFDKAYVINQFCRELWSCQFLA